MDLYLIRHAIAADLDPVAWPDDTKRPLTPDGAKRYRQAARGLRRLAPKVDAVLSSPYVRAWETAKILADRAGWPAPTRCDALAGGGTPSAVVRAMGRRGSAEAVALVGHEPNLSELATYLLAGEKTRPVLELKKGGVACLRIEGGLRPGAATLRWVVPPKVLVRLR